MAKISSKYNPDFVKYLKSIGGKWDPKTKTWTVPENQVTEIIAKAKEMNVQDLNVQHEPSQPQESPQQSVNLIAFASDVKQMLEGKRKTVRFRILPPRQQ